MNKPTHSWPVLFHRCYITLPRFSRKKDSLNPNYLRINISREYSAKWCFKLSSKQDFLKLYFLFSISERKWKIFHFIINCKKKLCAWNVQWCRSNRIVGQHLFRDHIRILSCIEKRVRFAVVETQKISFGWYSGDAKTQRNDRQSRGRIRSREQKWIHRFEYRTCSEKAATAIWHGEENREKRKRRERRGYKAQTGAKDDRRDLPT